MVVVIVVVLVMLKRLVSVFALFSKDFFFIFFLGEVVEKRSEAINKRSRSTSDRLLRCSENGEQLKPGKQSDAKNDLSDRSDQPNQPH